LGISEIARRLNVRYVVTGTVRKSENDLRVTAQLIDAESGSPIWSERYQRSTAEFFELQDEIATTIAGAIIPELSRSERDSLMRQHPKNLDSWGYCHKGFWNLYAFDISKLQIAEEFFNKAIELDPTFAQAHAGLAHAQMLICWYDSSKRSILESAERNIEHSIELDVKAPYSYFVQGRIFGAQPAYAKAIQAYETALELNPSFAQAHFGLGSIMMFSNRSELALEPIENALRLSPHDPQLWTFLHIKSRALLMLDRKEEALVWAQKMVSQSNAPYFAYQTLAAILGHMGRIKEARAAVEEVLKVKPDYTTEHYVDDSFSLDKSVTDYFLIGLRKAGLPSTTRKSNVVQDKPAIAVLPFVNMSNDTDQEYFSDGITEELINGLSKVRAFLVVARNSTFSLKKLDLEIAEIGNRLGVRYLVTGSVRKSNNRVRIAVNLIDVNTEWQLWNEQFDGTLDDIFDLQDQIARNVVAAVEPKIRKAEIDKAISGRSDNLDAYDYFLKALPRIFSMSNEGTTSGLELLRQAMEIDPEYHRAQSLAAWCYTLRRSQGITKKGNPETEYALLLANSALKGADDDPEILWQAGYAAGFFTYAFRDYIPYIDRSTAINPNSAHAWVVSGMARLFGGDPQAAIPHLQTSLKLSPSDPLSFRPQMAMAQAYMCLEKFEDAVEWAKRALQTETKAHPALRVMAASLAHLGRLDEAKQTVETLLEIFPDSSVELLQNTTVQQNSKFKQIYADGVRLAGLPEY
jgi:adenylate cyclase